MVLVHCAIYTYPKVQLAALNYSLATWRMQGQSDEPRINTNPQMAMSGKKKNIILERAN